MKVTHSRKINGFQPIELVIKLENRGEFKAMKELFFHALDVSDYLRCSFKITKAQCDLLENLMGKISDEFNEMTKEDRKHC